MEKLFAEYRAMLFFFNATLCLLQSQREYIRNIYILNEVAKTLAISDEEKSFACQELLGKYIEMGMQRGVNM